MTDKQNTIEISNLNVYAGDRKLLSDISVNIPRGTITVIMGPSGCGKTTLLRSLNRLTDLSGLNVSGQINFSGQDILSLRGYDVAAMRQRMGLLSQRPYPLPLSIFENVAYAVRLKGITRKTEVRSQVEHYLQLACLWDEVKDRLNNSPSTLSIGQQQRLCLARGLAVDPEVILADEPTSALDPISTQAIEQSFMQLKNDYTIILVSHILRQARRIADYVVFMYLGEMIESGEAQPFFSDPTNEITKKYL
ncbi:MAG TPA: phosphate ABC transporter ATP-binding protein, partial [Bacteroidales bacterium]|nr:phosphate ABC transporter ATP-binding protein [Bacteroidales bacterium]